MSFSPTLKIPSAICNWSDCTALSANENTPDWAAQVPHALHLTENGARPRQQTQVRIRRDTASLRVLFTAEDSHVWATLRERDEPLYKEEVFEVFLDTEGDCLGYFEIEVNPNNAVLDAAMRRVASGYRKDFRWRCEQLETMVRIFPGGWAAELRIPFSSVSPAPPEPGQRWRVNFTRIDRPPGAPRELSAWSPTGLAQFHVPTRFGIVEFAG
jgi:hypothetical protein